MNLEQLLGNAGFMLFVFGIFSFFGGSPGPDRDGHPADEKGSRLLSFLIIAGGLVCWLLAYVLRLCDRLAQHFGDKPGDSPLSVIFFGIFIFTSAYLLGSFWYWINRR